MRINTNIASLNAQTNATNTNLSLQSSLEKLSSGLKINKASDDASGMAIADKLRTQASSLGQGISNANSGSALIQIADAAMAEQSNILDTVKTKLIQASTSTTSAEGREAIRKDISKLLEQMDNISAQTNYNGVNLLDEKGAEFSFQVGEDSTFDIGLSTAYSVNTNGLGSAGNEGSTQASLKSTAGGFTIEGEVSNVKVTANASTAGALTLTAGSGQSSATIKISANDVTVLDATVGTLTLVTDDADTIAFLNKEADLTTADGLTKIADGQYQLTGTQTFQNGGSFDFADLKITNIDASDAIAITIGEKVSIEKTEGTADIVASNVDTFTVDGDTAEGVSMSSTSTNVLLQDGTVAISADTSSTNKYIAINTVNANTVSASGELTFTVASESLVKSLTLNNTASGSVTLSTTDGATAQALRDAGLTQNADSTFTLSNSTTGSVKELTFAGAGINISNLSFSDVSLNTAGGQDAIYIETSGSVTVENNKRDGVSADAANVSLSVSATNSAGSSDATGFSTSEVSSGLGSSNLSGLLSLGEGDLTTETANNFMSVVDDAMSQLNTVRSDFGSTQNQLQVATRNMMSTQVNIKAAESIIRDVDYAAESAAFNKQNIIAQAGTYAMSQANAMQQNVLRLLQ